MSVIVSEAELKSGLNIQKRPSLKLYLEDKGIRYQVTPKGELWTVDDEIKAAVQGRSMSESDEWDIGHAS